MDVIYDKRKTGCKIVSCISYHILSLFFIFQAALTKPTADCNIIRHHIDIGYVAGTCLDVPGLPG